MDSVGDLKKERKETEKWVLSGITGNTSRAPGLLEIVLCWTDFNEIGQVMRDQGGNRCSSILSRLVQMFLWLAMSWILGIRIGDFDHHKQGYCYRDMLAINIAIDLPEL